VDHLSKGIDAAAVTLDGLKATEKEARDAEERD
jgi:hypothetical protein